MRARIITVVIIFAGIWMGLLLRAFYLQVLPNETLSRLRNRQFETVVKLEPRRGDILDRKGVELAASVTAFSVFGDPKMIAEPKRLASRMATVLDLSSKEIYARIRNRQKRFVWIDRRISPQQKEIIEGWKEQGLGFVEEGRRIYPHESLFSQTLGFVGREGVGLAGLETKFEKDLHGFGKKVNVQKDAFGRPLIANGQVFSERPGGATIQLTLDSELQYFLEEELAKASRDHMADRAMGVILDAQTSEVLAAGSYPTFNPNKIAAGDGDFMRNPVVADVFEPGSTLKTFTIAAALRANKIQPSTKFYCEKGRMKVDDRWIREANEREKWEWLTVNQILEVSSNVGVTKIAFELGQEELRKAFVDFGFGEKTGLELPGETRGILPPLPWRKHHFSNISFGHGVAVSPIQIANAYAAIANGGILRQPTLLKTIYNSETKEVTTLPARNERRIFSEADANTLKLMLTGATTNLGTGNKARVPGFIVAGKTGTAQKVDPNGRGYIKGAYISSFAGFAPANQPKFVIYIAIDNSRKGYYGADIAAPVFNRVAEFALRSWGVTPSIITEKDVVTPVAASKTRELVKKLEKETPASELVSTDSVVPDLKGLTVREVLERTRGKNFELDFKGTGAVLGTIPAAGSSLSDGREIKVILGHESLKR